MIKRTLTNAGAPLTYANGSLASGVKITFQLVTNHGVATDVFDSTTGERIPPTPITATTNSAGVFSVDLWPTSRGDAAVYYLCKVPIAGVTDLVAPLPDNAGAYTWVQFKAGSTGGAPAWVPTPLEMLDVSAWPNLAAAIGDISTYGKTLWISTAVSCNDLTITNRDIRVLFGGMITVSPGHTLTFGSNASFDAGAYQTFAGSGAVVGLRQLRPENFGATFDNATDDSAAIGRSLTSAAPGATIIFPTSKTAYVGSQSNVVDSLVIEGNGSTLRGANITPLWFGVNKFTLSAMSVTVTANTPAIVFPDASGIAPGDMLVLMSTSVRLAISPANYLNGHIGTVRAVVGNTVYLRNPSPFSFTASTINVRKGLAGSRILNLNIDVSASTTNATSPALALYGHDIEVAHCSIVGGTRSGYGVMAYGESLSIHDNQVAGFLNVQGLSDGGRIGDGIYVAGDNILVAHNTVTECKHCISAGDRSVVSNNVQFIDNFTSQDIANVNATVTNETTLSTDSYYGACLDFHANVYKGALIADNRIIAGSMGINIRNGTGIVRNNSIYCQKYWSYGVYVSEFTVSSLLITGNEYEGQGHVNDVFVYQGVNGSDIKIVDNLRIKNGGIFANLAGGAINISNSDISRNIATRGNLVAGTFGISTSGFNMINGLKIHSNNITNYAAAIYGYGTNASNNLDISGNQLLGNVSGIELDQVDSFTSSFGLNIVGNNILYGSSDGSLYPTGISTNLYASIPIAAVNISGNMIWNSATNAHARSIRINGLNEHIIKGNIVNEVIADNTATYKYSVADNHFVGVDQTWNGYTVKSKLEGGAPTAGTAQTGGAVYSGTYTPTVTDVNNITTASTPYVWQWLRVGDTVTVSGLLSITPYAANTFTHAAFTLPVPSDFVSTSNCSGAGATTDGQAAAIYGDASTNLGQIGFKSIDTALKGLYVNFTYQVM